MKVTKDSTNKRYLERRNLTSYKNPDKPGRSKGTRDPGGGLPYESDGDARRLA